MIKEMKWCGMHWVLDKGANFPCHLHWKKEIFCRMVKVIFLFNQKRILFLQFLHNHQIFFRTEKINYTHITVANINFPATQLKLLFEFCGRMIIFQLCMHMCAFKSLNWQVINCLCKAFLKRIHSLQLLWVLSTPHPIRGKWKIMFNFDKCHHMCVLLPVRVCDCSEWLSIHITP